MADSVAKGVKGRVGEGAWQPVCFVFLLCCVVCASFQASVVEKQISKDALKTQLKKLASKHVIEAAEQAVEPQKGGQKEVEAEGG